MIKGNSETFRINQNLSPKPKFFAMRTLAAKVYGAMDKKADGDICAHFLCFSTYFSEIFSISFFFRGRLNGAVKSDLTLLHRCTFCTAQRTFCTVFQTFLFFKVES
jgi:hypothetical protein